jgi:hypothetical protein
MGTLRYATVHRLLLPEARTGLTNRSLTRDARRASLVLAEEAQDVGSAEAEHLRMLEVHREEFAREWLWEEGE